MKKNQNLIISLLLLPLLLLPLLTNAGAWQDRRSRLEQVAVYKQFRIFYSLSGKEALPSKHRLDANKNSTPDFIEHIGKRLITADNFFSNDVHLKPPLKSKRYINQAHYIDVNVLNFTLNKKGPKNGIAYDGTPKFNRSLARQRSTKVLVIDLNNSLNLKTNTVEHELFHLYQNGYSYFKNRWYTEGTARWSELVSQNKLRMGKPLPRSNLEKQQLFKQSYQASSFWNELIAKTDKSNNGKKFIKLLLEQLAKADDIAARKRGISNKNWPEKQQRSALNNDFIYNAAIQVSKQLNGNFNLIN